MIVIKLVNEECFLPKFGTLTRCMGGLHSLLPKKQYKLGPWTLVSSIVLGRIEVKGQLNCNERPSSSGE